MSIGKLLRGIIIGACAVVFSYNFVSPPVHQVSAVTHELLMDSSEEKQSITISLNNDKPLVAGTSNMYTIQLIPSTEDVFTTQRQLTLNLQQGYMIDLSVYSSLDLEDEQSRQQLICQVSRVINLPSGIQLDDIILQENYLTGLVISILPQQTAQQYDITFPVSVDLYTIDEIYETGNTSLNLLIHDGQSSDDQLQVQLADILKPVDISMHQVVVYPNKSNQNGSDIVIAETSPSMIREGNIIIMFENNSGLSF